MTRKRVTASEKKQRHEWAVRQIDAGMGLSELTASTAETWGCSHRSAHLKGGWGTRLKVVETWFVVLIGL